MLVKLEQLWKASLPIEIMPLPIVIFSNLVQLEKVLSLIEVTLSGIVTLVNEQPLNAVSPIYLTLSGIVMEVKLSQS